MNFINWITKTKKLILFHPESPGMKIIVYRTFLGGLFKDSDFATLNETIKLVELNDDGTFEIEKIINTTIDKVK